VDETSATEQERVRLRRAVDLMRSALRGMTGTWPAQPDAGWVMSADGVIGAAALTAASRGDTPESS
jgi:hypothetical protein